MHELKRRYPALNLLLTTITVTSAKVAASRLPEGAIHQFMPLDSPTLLRALHRALASRSRPFHRVRDLAEPHRRGERPQGAACARQCADVAALDQTLGAAVEPQQAGLLPVRSRPDAELALRKASNGPRRKKSRHHRQPEIRCAAPARSMRQLCRSLRRSLGDRPVFLAASTHPGEDEAIARAHEMLQSAMPSLLTVIVPRHPDRGEAIVCASRRAPPESRLRGRAGEQAGADTQVYLADTIGELGLFYSLAPLSFIGGSLVRMAAKIRSRRSSSAPAF